MERYGSHSLAVENYLKAIYMLSMDSRGAVSTQLLSRRLRTTPSAVSGMVEKLAQQGYLHRKKYKGVHMSAKGVEVAVGVVRRHRLWEVFLHEKLGFDWSEVHEMAEELEHINSKKLIQRLDMYLDYPQIDPHGDPIPNASGKMPIIKQLRLSALKSGEKAKLIGIKDSSPAFLKHVDTLGLTLGLCFEVKQIFQYDGAMALQGQTKKLLFLSKKVADNLLVIRQS